MKKHREKAKNTGKRQGKHREFGLDRSVATLYLAFTETIIYNLGCIKIIVFWTGSGVFPHEDHTHSSWSQHPTGWYQSNEESYQQEYVHGRFIFTVTLTVITWEESLRIWKLMNVRCNHINATK